MNFRINDWGITARVLIVALLPVTIVTLVLGHYIIDSRTQDLVNEIGARGKVIAESLASASEFGVVTGNTEILQGLVQSVLRDADVVSIRIFDNNDNPLYVSDKGAEIDPSARIMPTLFIADIHRSQLSPDEFQETTRDENARQTQHRIGYVQVRLSSVLYGRRQATIIRNSLFISIAGLVISLGLALLISRGVTLPVKHLMTAVAYLRRGDYSTRVSRMAGGEIGDLQLGINGMAEQIESSHKQLEQKVEQAVTRYKGSITELQQRNYELQIARQEAMKAGESKSEFLANMSHEIRTPLNAIIGFSRRLAKSTVNHEQLECIHTVTSAANQLLSVIDDVLNYSKLEYGKMDISPVNVDIRKVLEDVIAMMSDAAHDKKLELVLLADSDVPAIVRVDPTRLGQILTNLVSNAIKFTDSGDVVVHLSVVDNEPGMTRFRLSIADTGIGIDKDEQAKLFKPFSQADMSSTRRYGGTGLGLVICKRLVELMNGSIWMSSVKGEGTTFYIEISLESDDSSQHHNDALLGYSALLFDTHLYSRRAIRNSLVHMGVNTYTASNENALESMLSRDESEARYDVLIISVPASTEASTIKSRILPLVKQHYQGPLFVLTSDEDYMALCLASHESRTAFALKPVRNTTLQRELLNIFGVLPIQHATSAGDEDGEAGQHDIQRVLVAEDNDFNRLYITRLLEDRGISVDCAANGEQAMVMAIRNKYHLVLMDVHMPVLDGVEATRLIREAMGNSAPRIIAVTADVFANDEGNLTNKGFDDCLFKPIAETELYSTIESCCGVRFGSQPGGDIVAPVPAAEQVVSLRHVPADLQVKLLAELPQHLDAISEYIESGDLLALRERLHTFLGVCSYFGIRELTGELLEMQQLVRDKNLASAGEKLLQIKTIVHRLESEWYFNRAETHI